jgi:type I restriction enzyme M protein
MMNPLTTGFGGTYPGAMFDVVLANPPFSGKVQDESILADLNYKLNARATELLFLKWFIDHLSPGGWAGVIVPNGVLFGSAKAATRLRELLLSEWRPPDCHQPPQRRVQTLRRCRHRRFHRRQTLNLQPSTKSVWFYDITADGFSLDDKRSPIEPNDIPAALAKWPAREEGPTSYRVPVEKIRKNDWFLAAGRYKPVTAAAVNHDAPADILGEIITLEEQIAARAKKLHSVLK